MDPLLLILIGVALVSVIAPAVVKRFILENSDFWMSMGIIFADREGLRGP